MPDHETLRPAQSEPQAEHKPARASPNNIKYPTLSATVVERLLKSGHNKCFTQYYTTNGIESHDGYINHVVKSINKHAFVSFERIEEIVFFQNISMRQGQKKDEDRLNIVWEEPQPIKGDYVLLHVPYINDSSNAESDGNRISSILRTFLGDLFSKEMHACFTHEIDEKGFTISGTSRPSYIYPFSDNIYSDFATCRKGIDFSIDANPRALELLYDANEQVDQFISFVLIWLAVEAQLSDGSGQRSGERRRKFIKDSLRSPIIDNEIHTLFKIRCDCFKSSARVSITQFDKYSAISFLRLAMLKDSEMRRALVKVYEKRIQTERS